MDQQNCKCEWKQWCMLIAVKDICLENSHFRKLFAENSFLTLD